jgi:hypothetical protein
MSLGGALGGPLTAFQYDWNMLPIGQQLWLDLGASQPAGSATQFSEEALICCLPSTVSIMAPWST